MVYFCCDEGRRQAVEDHDTLNGIDYLEVIDSPSMPDKDRQRTLLIYFIKPLVSSTSAGGGSPPSADNIRIEGGERVRNISVTKATPGTGAKARILTVEVNIRGDFSIYTLRLVKGPKQLDLPPDGFDKILSAIDFSFKVNCPSDFDCRRQLICPPAPHEEPDINYLAKDYASFRQLALDRMIVLMPEWKERAAADLGITLVELLAYVGDYLSYAQDAVVTEAYLGTARRRVSVRRHARLADYFIDDGCNARVWVHLEALVNGIELKHMTSKGTTKFLTSVSAEPSTISHADYETLESSGQALEVFELMEDVTLFKDHNEMYFYTWSSRECCLPKGSTSATLRGHLPNLTTGSVIILKEERGPKTGEPEDADPAHRHVIRLTKAESKDTGGVPLTDPVTGQLITEIMWHAEDALPFPLCISATTDSSHGRQYIEDVSVALGNIVLADHGVTIEDEYLGSVPDAVLFRAPVESGAPCEEVVPEALPPRFGPRLGRSPLTQAAPLGNGSQPSSAHAAMHWSAESVLPAIHLTTQEGSRIPEWTPRRDLLKSVKEQNEFVVEIESDNAAYLRFGNGEHGARPSSGTKFYATYRVGNGTAGNIGAETLKHIVTDKGGIDKVSNPLPAQGGTDPESIERVRQNAPSAFRTQERAVTPADYAEVATRHSGVQRAAATLRWTGSWYTVFLTVDRLDGLEIDAEFENSMRRHLEAYRMAGHDVEVDGPRYVPLEIELQVCVDSDYFRSDVRAALIDLFSNRILPDGQRGVFHPDNFTFGQPVYLSYLISAAQAVAGVTSVRVTKFQRQDAPGDEALETGTLSLDRLEIARLDNDPNFPHRGIFSVIAEGGK
jgi:hypothetical protein